MRVTRLSLFFLFLLQLARQVSAVRRDYEFVYRRYTTDEQDGKTNYIIQVNGGFVGPEIRANVGDLIVVNVTNYLSAQEGLTVHWHGMRQISTPWSDGVAYITNCPIPFGGNYTYSFLAHDSGTFWYHSHIETMRGEGGYGFIVIEEQVPIATYDEELLVVLADYYDLSYKFLQAGVNNFGPQPSPNNNPYVIAGYAWPNNGNSILVNGQGGAQRVYIDVEPNKIYRVRLLNAALLAFFNLAIAGHNMTIIQAQAMPTVPVSLSSIDISTAQRFDFLLSTHGMQAALYQVNIQSNYEGLDTSRAGTLANSVFLRYSMSSVESPLMAKNTTKPWNEQVEQVKPLSKNNNGLTIPPPTVELFFNMSQQFVDAKTLIGFDYSKTIYENGYLRWTANTVSYQMPPTPLLLSSYYNLLSQETNTASKPVRIELNDVVQVVIQNRVEVSGQCDEHPWHLHGYSFYVLAQGEGDYFEYLSTLSPEQRSTSSYLNTVNPVVADTVVSFPANFANLRTTNYSTITHEDYNKPCGWTVIRFVASNPGMWLFHCHIEWDFESGMGLVFDVASETLWSSGLALPSNYGFCGDINANTPNPHASSGGSSSSSSSSSSNTDLLAFSKAQSLILAFSIFGACVCGMALKVLFDKVYKPPKLSHSVDSWGSGHSVDSPIRGASGISLNNVL